MQKLISIVTPTYNEEGNIEDLCSSIAKEMSKTNYDYEHIVIDNNSSDKTISILRKLSNKDKKLKVIINTRDFGHIKSPIHGLLQTSGDASILMSSDFQDPPELIHKYIKEWENGHKVVLGQKESSDEFFLKQFFKNIFYKFIKSISELPLMTNTTGAGLFDREILNQDKDLNSIFDAARSGDLELIKKISNEDKSAVNQQSTDGTTPLIAACSFGRNEAVNLLISLGAALDKRNLEGSTAISVAVFFGYPEIVSNLIREGLILISSPKMDQLLWTLLLHHGKTSNRITIWWVQ